MKEDPECVWVQNMCVVGTTESMAGGHVNRSHKGGIQVRRCFTTTQRPRVTRPGHRTGFPLSAGGQGESADSLSLPGHQTASIGALPGPGQALLSPLQALLT